MEKWIIMITSLCVLVLICWKESRRKNKAQIALRLTASVLAALSLYFISQPISFQREMDTTKENTAVLLTNGFEKDSLIDLKNIPLYTTEPNIVRGNKNVTFVPTLEDFTRSHAELNTIHILGNGLNYDELESIGNLQLIFHPNIISGFSSVHWNNNVSSGEKLVVQGSFKHESKKTVKILLKGLSTTLDSVTVTSSQPFELSTTPKLLDKAIYSLIALSGKDTLASEKVPFIIKEKIPLKILILSSSPDFESKFLKNWLFAEHYSLAIRNNISKDKFSTEFLNMERINLDRLSPAQLEKFDILIGDMGELSRLNATENYAIQNQINKGMGLVVRSDSIGGTGFYRNAFKIRQHAAINEKNSTLSWTGKIARKALLPAGSTLDIIPASGEQPLVRDDKNHVLVSSKIYGEGRMIVSTVVDTYTWMLSANSADYSSYWSYILEKAARKSTTTERWAILNTLPVVNSPIRIMLENSTKNRPSASAGNTPLHFEQDATQLFRWSADYWPTNSGWHSIRSGNKDYSWYVFDENDWQSLRAAEKIKKTAKFISESKSKVEKARSTASVYRYTIPSIYFFMLFLLASGYLWAEGKMEQR